MALTATSSEMSFSLSRPRRAVMSMSTRFPPLVRLRRRTRFLGRRRRRELHLHAAAPQLAEAEPAPHGLRPGGLPLRGGRLPGPAGGLPAGSLAPALLDDVDLHGLVVGRHHAALD